MKYNTKSIIVHVGKARLHMLVVISCLALALLGWIPESWTDWVVCPPSRRPYHVGDMESRRKPGLACCRGLASAFRCP